MVKPTVFETASEDLGSLLTSHAFAELAGMHIFATGCTGFFGFWLLTAIACLNRQGHRIEIVALSRDPTAFLRRHPEFAASRWLSFVTGDVSSFRLAPTNFDAVIHGATDTSPRAAANPSVLLADIVDGTSNVLRQLAATGYGRLLLISSGAVYGQQGESVESLHEDMDWATDSLMPADAYGEGKRSAEMQCACSADEGLPAAVVARCFAFVGPYLPAHLAPAQFVRDLLNKGEIVLHGDGTALRSYLDAADLAIWLLTLLARGTAGRAYNVGGVEAISIGELADTIRDVLRPGAIVRRGGQADHAPRHRYLPDTARARAELGLMSWTPLRLSIARMAQAVQVAR